MLESVSWKSFHEQLHSTFRMAVPGREAVPLELFEVTAPMEPRFSPNIEQFSLLFRGPLSPGFPQGIYALEHDRLGAGQLFVVPIGPDAHGMRYEVVFSRAAQPSG